jgi:hypothetical protein
VTETGSAEKTAEDATSANDRVWSRVFIGGGPGSIIDRHDPQMVPRTGLEPARLTAHAPQTCVSTNSTTWAFKNRGGLMSGNPLGLSSPEIGF